MRQILCEGAFSAERRLFFAITLANFNQQGMKLIEKLCITGQLAVDEFLGRRIIGICRQPAMAGKNPARVGIRDEKRLSTRIEEDSINRFIAQPLQLHQLLSQDIGRC